MVDFNDHKLPPSTGLNKLAGISESFHQQYGQITTFFPNISPTYLDVLLEVKINGSDQWVVSPQHINHLQLGERWNMPIDPNHRS